jgi:hypothetical protein
MGVRLIEAIAQCRDTKLDVDGGPLEGVGIQDMRVSRRMVVNRSSVSAMDVVTRRIFSQAREGIIVLFLGWLAATGRTETPAEEFACVSP